VPPATLRLPRRHEGTDSEVALDGETVVELVERDDVVVHVGLGLLEGFEVVVGDEVVGEQVAFRYADLEGDELSGLYLALLRRRLVGLSAETEVAVGERDRAGDGVVVFVFRRRLRLLDLDLGDLEESAITEPRTVASVLRKRLGAVAGRSLANEAVGDGERRLSGI